MAQSLGQLLGNDILPDELQVSGPMTKKELYKRIYTMARRGPKDAADRIDRIRFLGHQLATTEGLSIGLDDIAPDPRKKKLLAPLMEKIKKTDDITKRQKIILDAEKKILPLSPEHPGSMGEMMRAGARGKPIQLMRTANAQIHANDPVTGSVIPWLIPRGYSEGLKPSEHWVANTEARTNLINARVAVTEPGAASKVLINNMNNIMILGEDCGTHNGIMMDTSDPNIMDRYLARSEAGFTRNTLVTPHVISKLRNKRKLVMVRSPMTCELNDGVCQKCQGLDERGQLHHLGTNIGIRSAQAISEPITQMQISARHGVRGETSDIRKVRGMEGLKQMMEIPKSFINKATLATSEGKIDLVERAPQGGFNIHAAAQKYYIPPGLSPIVREGQNVSPGDALSDGIPKPDEVVQFKGLGAGRKYMVERLNDIYRDRGIDLDRRHLEILARSHLNHVRIEEDPESRFHPGEIVNYSTLLKSLADDVKEVPVKEAPGNVLAKGTLHHMAGTPVTQEMVKELVSNKIKNVIVSSSPPKISFFMRPLSRNPLLNPDWMARLGHRYLKETILEGAHTGQVSDIHGTHPVPAYAYGREFGKGVGGRY